MGGNFFFFFFFLEVGINLWGIVLNSGTNDQIMPRRGGVSKNTFSFDLIKVNHKCLRKNHEYSFADKALDIP